MGGHAAALIAAGRTVEGVDRDATARSLARQRLGPDVPIVPMSYGEAVSHFADEGRQFAGILADLGVSSLQLDDAARGFSIRSQSPLDLRMDVSQGETALELIDRLSAEELADIIYQYGEERASRRVARYLKQARAEGQTTGEELAAVVRRAVPGHHKRHPALRTFQALRIAVNDELGQLETLLRLLPDILLPDGVAVIITFHSLEDRLVKQRYRGYLQDGIASSISRRPERANDAELSANKRSAPAKLRWMIRSDTREGGSR
jgi:16S rRNA (cytosine1402-N4)-methyltransferase